MGRRTVLAESAEPTSRSSAGPRRRRHAHPARAAPPGPRIVRREPHSRRLFALGAKTSTRSLSRPRAAARRRDRSTQSSCSARLLLRQEASEGGRVSRRPDREPDVPCVLATGARARAIGDGRLEAVAAASRRTRHSGRAFPSACVERTGPRPSGAGRYASGAKRSRDRRASGISRPRTGSRCAAHRPRPGGGSPSAARKPSPNAKRRSRSARRSSPARSDWPCRWARSPAAIPSPRVPASPESAAKEAETRPCEFTLEHHDDEGRGGHRRGRQHEARLEDGARARASRARRSQAASRRREFAASRSPRSSAAARARAGRAANESSAAISATSRAQSSHSARWASIRARSASGRSPSR